MFGGYLRLSERGHASVDLTFDGLWKEALLGREVTTPTARTGVSPARSSISVTAVPAKPSSIKSSNATSTMRSLVVWSVAATVAWYARPLPPPPGGKSDSSAKDHWMDWALCHRAMVFSGTS
jgi:hypothetical protein